MAYASVYVICASGIHGVYVVNYFGLVLFGPNDLRPTVFGCQATHLILQQVSTRKKSLGPYTDSELDSWLTTGNSWSYQ